MSSTSSIISLTREPAWTSKLKAARHHLRRNPLVTIGLAAALMWLLIMLTAPRISPYSPLRQDLADRLQAPNADYLMGTDELGRDIFSRVLWGARITIPAGLSVVVIGSLLGIAIGALTGYVGGLVDELIMRVIDLFMAFPPIILAMAITAALGPDIKNAVLALLVVWWPGYGRMMRALVMAGKTQEYVDAARSVGAGGPYILFRTILPNCIAPAGIMATLDIGNAIIVFAGLSFIGLGPDPSSPEWGRMVSDGIDFFDQWWMWLFPGLAIASLVMSFNFIGDGLRDILDPRMRGE